MKKLFTLYFPFIFFFGKRRMGHRAVARGERERYLEIVGFTGAWPGAFKKGHFSFFFSPIFPDFLQVPCWIRQISKSSTIESGTFVIPFSPHPWIFQGDRLWAWKRVWMWQDGVLGLTILPSKRFVHFIFYFFIFIFIFILFCNFLFILFLIPWFNTWWSCPPRKCLMHTNREKIKNQQMRKHSPSDSPFSFSFSSSSSSASSLYPSSRSSSFSPSKWFNSPFGLSFPCSGCFTPSSTIGLHNPYRFYILKLSPPLTYITLY